MVYRKLSEQSFENAKDYISIKEKEKFVQQVAGKIIDKVEIKTGEGDWEQPIPPAYKENYSRKRRYLMGAFVKLYLGVEEGWDHEAGEPLLMTQRAFDSWAGGHIFNQVDQMKKRGGALRQKAFDMLEDYNNLKSMLHAEVEGMLRIMNDPCQRMMAMMRMQTTPEELERGKAELEKMVGELKSIRDKKEKGVNNES